MMDVLTGVSRNCVRWLECHTWPKGLKGGMHSTTLQERRRSTGQRDKSVHNPAVNGQELVGKVLINRKVESTEKRQGDEEC